ncbi:MAG: cobalt ABC transporter ATP-binding protein [Chloroflexi bacterium RBG_16_50_9]|nr:MAG: cobalt ABC transporter ATP-binding protein [Chloroflexi bacterium RBG_16_50_9]
MDEVVRIKNLSFAYPDGRQALTDVSLHIGRGESVALIGPNGAGKSTLLLHLNGILHTDGRVEVLSRKISEKSLGEIRRKIGIVFQNPDDQLFSATVFDDVAFGPINLGYAEAKVRQAVTRALDRVGMAGYEARSPHHLSLGEKKRIAIATILSMDPEVMVMDEPTSNLDPAGKWLLIELLQGLSITKIIATHDLDLARALCQRVVVLDKGRIVADGAADLILADMPLLAAHGLARAAI